MDVDVEGGFIFADQPHDGSHLGLVQLHEVAVQVLIGGRMAPALNSRSPLVGATVGRGALVAVNGQDRDQDQIGAIEQSCLVPERHVAEQHHACVLAVDFAGVDSGLSDQDRLRGVQWSCIFGSNHGIDRPTFGREAELFDPNEIGSRVQSIEPGAGVGVVGAGVPLWIALELGDPGMFRGSQQTFAVSIPIGGGRQEGLVPGGESRIGLGHDRGRC